MPYYYGETFLKSITSNGYLHGLLKFRGIIKKQKPNIFPPKTPKPNIIHGVPFVTHVVYNVYRYTSQVTKKKKSSRKMSFGINGPSPQFGIQEAQNMRNNGGGGNLGYFQRQKKDEKKKKDEKNKMR